MSDFKYRPRRGFDISASSGKKKRAVKKDTGIDCEIEGCEEGNAIKVRKDPKSEAEFLWLCKKHATEHNKNWDFFSGMSPSEMANYRRNEFYGHRPTWKMSSNTRARMGDSKYSDISKNLGDIENTMFENEKEKSKKKFTRLQLKAFESLNLDPPSTKEEIRNRYAELVKAYHPDQNGGDRNFEEKLHEVVNAFRILRNSKVC